MRRSGLALLLLCAALLLAAAPAGAEVSFQTTTLEPAGFVEDVAVGDVDGVNGPDIVTAYSEGGIGVQLNDGHGHFGPTHMYATGCDTNQVELADVGAPPNSIFPDGHLDAVIACSYGGGETIELGRMFGDGAGGFSEPVMFGESNYGSFNGLSHNHQGFALAEYRGTSGPPIPVWHREVQPAPFQFKSEFCLSYDWSSAQCTNYDEAPEPYVPVVAGRVAEAEAFTTGGPEGLVAWGPASGVWTGAPRDFGPEPFVTTGGDALNSIAIGDLQGDGPDILTAASTLGAVPNEPATGRISVLYGNAGGVPPQKATTFASALGVEGIATGDFDLDGHTDVVGSYWHYLSGTGTGGVFVQSGDGAGHLGAPQEIPLYNGETFNYNVPHVADLDGNGTPDVVAIVGGKVQVLLNQKTPPPPPPKPVPPPAPISKALTEALAGIKGLGTKATALPTGYVTLGTATNPPTKAVAITITIPGKGKAKGSSLATARTKGKKKPAKPTVIGKANITVPAGKTVPLKVKLTGAARAKLKKGPLHGTVTLVATSTAGAKQTKVSKLTIEPAAKAKGKKKGGK